MSLIVTLKSRNPDGELNTIERYVADFKKNLPDLHGEDIICVEATDEELMYIDENFDNWPRNLSKRKVRWYGDMAKFIYFNL